MVSKIFRNDERISSNSCEMEQRMKTMTNQREKLKDLCKKYAQVSLFSSCSKSRHPPHILWLNPEKNQGVYFFFDCSFYQSYSLHVLFKDLALN